MRTFAVTLAVTLCLLASSAMADTIPIVNPSLEMLTPANTDQFNYFNQGTIDGWTQTHGDSNAAGVWRNSQAATTGERGMMMGYYTAGPTVVVQLLDHDIVAGDEFTLSFDLWSWEAGNGVQADLYYMDGTAQSFASEIFAVAGSGSGNVARYELTSSAFPAAAVGNKLGIMLTGYGTSDNAWSNMDSFEMSLIPGEPGIPEPATMSVLAIGGVMGLLKRKRK